MDGYSMNTHKYGHPSFEEPIEPTPERWKSVSVSDEYANIFDAETETDAFDSNLDEYYEKLAIQKYKQKKTA